MIESIEYIDYQRFKRTKIKLGQGITTLIGESDAGKSSSIRGLKQVCLNPKVPSRELPLKGPQYARHGKSNFVIRLKIRTKGKRHTIELHKGTKGNWYSLNYKKFSAIKNKVPHEIAQLLNVSELSFQDQHSQPLWLHLSAPQVGRELNAVIDLDTIDRILSNAASIVRKESSRIEVTKDRLSEAERELKELQDAEQFIGQIRRLEKLEREIERRGKQIQKGDSLLSQMSDGISNVSDLQNQIRTKGLTQLEILAKRIQIKQRQIDLGNKLLSDIKDSQDRTSHLTRESKLLSEQLLSKTRSFKECPLCLQPIK